MMQNHNYEDIIDLPNHQSKTRPHMSMHKRTAQFSPFRAVGGHEDAVEDSARLTVRRMELDEDELNVLDRNLQRLQAHLDARLIAEITWFVPDSRKDGGIYKTVMGRVI